PLGHFFESAFFFRSWERTFSRPKGSVVHRRQLDSVTLISEMIIISIVRYFATLLRVCYGRGQSEWLPIGRLGGGKVANRPRPLWPSRTWGLCPGPGAPLQFGIFFPALGTSILGARRFGALYASPKHDRTAGHGLSGAASVRGTGRKTSCKPRTP